MAQDLQVTCTELDLDQLKSSLYFGDLIGTPSTARGRCFLSRLTYKNLTCVVALLVMGGHLLHAEVTGSMSGTVVDQSGATVPNATVILKHPDTGLVRRVQTNASGSYEFLSVPTGENYSL